MFSDVFKIRILVVVENTVKKVLLLEFVCKRASVEPNKLETQRRAYFSTIITRQLALIIMGQIEITFCLGDGKNLVYPIRTGNRIHGSGVIPCRLRRAYLQRLDTCTISRIGRNESVFVSQVVPVVIKTLEWGRHALF